MTPKDSGGLHELGSSTEYGSVGAAFRRRWYARICPDDLWVSTSITSLIQSVCVPFLENGLELFKSEETVALAVIRTEKTFRSDADT